MVHGYQKSMMVVEGCYSMTIRQITPKAFANFSPGLELATTLGAIEKSSLNPERVRHVHR
jgi:hypothetical protein